MPKKQSKQSKQKDKQQQQQVRKDALGKLGIVFLGILIIANTIMISGFGEVVERVDKYNRGIVDELGYLGNDMNDMRSALSLPTKNYSFLEEDSGIQEGNSQEASDTEKALYMFLGSYKDEQITKETARKAEEKIRNLNNDENFKKELSENGLNVGAVEQNDTHCFFKVTDSKTFQPLFNVIIDKQENAMRVQSVLGEVDTNENEVSSYLTKNKDQVVAMKQKVADMAKAVARIAANKDVKSILKEKKLSFSATAEEDENGYNYPVKNSEGSEVIKVTVLRKEGKYELSGQKYETEEPILEAFLNALKEADGSTELEKMVNERKAEAEKIFQEEAFKELLKINGLTIETQPREEYNKVLYDVKNTDGNTEFSFVIELSSGLFKILKNNEEIDLYSILTANDAKKKL